MKKRFILHIDMDYFFAQIEERENSWLKDKIVIVGANPKKGKGRGVVSTCNYKARSYGIMSGMPISKAYKITPHAIFLPVNMKHYISVSMSIFKIVEAIVDKKNIEEVSIDEAYINITNIIKSFKEGKELGNEIKSKILEKEKLTCTIGISENKMLAKIACNMAKPNGIKTISIREGEKIINKMKITTIPGIGPKTEKKFEKYLNKKNLTIKDAKKIKKQELIALIGKKGSSFYDNFRGKDFTSIKSKKIAKSIGKEYTFQKDSKNPKEIISVFKKMIASVEKELMQKKLGIKTIVVICRFENFKKYTKQKKFHLNHYDREILYKEGIPLLLNLIINTNKKIRLIGFRVIIK